MKPIYDNRTIVGYANNPQQAERIVRSLLQTIPKGWKVSVRMRDTDIIQLPEGWIYSVHP
jgi:hypothetical protein